MSLSWRAFALFGLVLSLLWYHPQQLQAQTELESIRISSRMDLNSILISGVDVVFFYDDSIVGNAAISHFNWYSRKREYIQSHGEDLDIVYTSIPQGFDSARLRLPERAASALRVLVFSEHQNPQAEAFDITGMQDVRIEIDQFGVIISEP